MIRKRKAFKNTISEPFVDNIMSVKVITLSLRKAITTLTLKRHTLAFKMFTNIALTDKPQTAKNLTNVKIV